MLAPWSAAIALLGPGPNVTLATSDSVHPATFDALACTVYTPATSARKESRDDWLTSCSFTCNVYN